MSIEQPQRSARAARPALWRSALATVWVLLLGGCALAPPRLPQHMPEGWQHAAGVADAPRPDLHGWWKAFDDPVLDRLVDAALADNLGLAEAELRIASARILAGHAGAGYWPQLSAHTFSEPTPDSSASYFQFGFDAKWELALFGRARSLDQVAAAAVGQAEGAAQAVRVSVVAEVARSYNELRAAQERLDLLAAAAASAAQRVSLMRTRARLLLASDAEVGQAEADAATAQAALHEPRLAIETALQQLAVLQAREEPDPAWRTAAPLPELGEVAIDVVPAELLRARPEVRRAESEVLRATGELGLARADRFPRIGIGGSLTYSSKILGATRLATADSIATLGPAIDIPLFDWGMRRAAEEARAKDLTAALVAYRQAVLEAVAEAETALATLAQQERRRQDLTRALAASARASENVAVLRRLGLADDLERLQGESGLNAARLAVAEAARARAVAFIALYKALGGAPLPGGRR
jgi:NodT family efflux transporter outer membrane factor (OMF) lipoprotein